MNASMNPDKENKRGDQEKQTSLSPDFSKLFLFSVSSPIRTIKKLNFLFSWTDYESVKVRE